MTDQYLCRGKRLDGDRDWVVGYLIVFADGETYICTADDIPDCLTKCKVDPSTVGRCTGLRDINGKLIFEGDIFKNLSKDSLSFRPHVVAYGPVTGGYGYPWLDKADRLTVVGNAHNNPELFGCGKA